MDTVKAMQKGQNLIHIYYGKDIVLEKASHMIPTEITMNLKKARCDAFVPSSLPSLEPCPGLCQDRSHRQSLWLWLFPGGQVRWITLGPALQQIFRTSIRKMNFDFSFTGWSLLKMKGKAIRLFPVSDNVFSVCFNSFHWGTDCMKEVYIQYIYQSGISIKHEKNLWLCITINKNIQLYIHLAFIFPGLMRRQQPNV